MFSAMRSSSAEVDRSSPAPVSIKDLLDRAKRSRLPSPAQRRQIRVDAGVTVREMAALTGVSPMAISRWERGSTPAIGHALRYREILDALREAT